MRHDTFETLKLAYSKKGNNVNLKNASGKVINVLVNTSAYFELGGEKLKQDFCVSNQIKTSINLWARFYLQIQCISQVRRKCL